jgi:aspartate 1-decarboxylase
VEEMLRIICKSKIHKATVTSTNLHYPGSITVDKALLEAANIFPNERVQVVNLNNGARVETYVTPGDEGVICMNGAAARWAEPEDKIIIISYALMEEEEGRNYKPKIVFVEENNKIKKIEEISTLNMNSNYWEV